MSQSLSLVVNIRRTPYGWMMTSSNELRDISAELTTRPAAESEETNETTHESDDSDLLILASIQWDDNRSYSKVVNQSECPRESSWRQQIRRPQNSSRNLQRPVYGLWTQSSIHTKYCRPTQDGQQMCRFIWFTISPKNQLKEISWKRQYVNRLA